MVLVEETPGGSAGEWPSSLPGEVCREIAGAVPPAGVNDDVDDVAKVVAADAAFWPRLGYRFRPALLGRCP